MSSNSCHSIACWLTSCSCIILLMSAGRGKTSSCDGITPLFATWLIDLKPCWNSVLRLLSSKMSPGGVITLYSRAEMQELLPDVFRSVLSFLRFDHITRLSMTSLGMNYVVAELINPCTRDGLLWWSLKLSKDFGEHNTQHPANEMYCYRAMPLDFVLEYSVRNDVSWMFLDSSWDNWERNDWIIVPNEAKMYARLASSQTEKIRQLALDYPTNIELISDLVKIGRADLAVRMAPSIDTRNMTAIEHILSLLAHTYNQDPKSIDAIIVSIITNPRYVGWASGSAILSASDGLCDNCLRFILQNAKRSGGKIAGIEYNNGSALLTAVDRQSVSTVALLLLFGANPIARNGKAFRRAVQLQNYAIMRILSDAQGFSKAYVKPKEAAALHGETRVLLDSLAAGGKVILQ